jgi:hypothetical protein
MQPKDIFVFELKRVMSQLTEKGDWIHPPTAIATATVLAILSGGGGQHRSL